jgi:hypothetical protein
MVEDRSQGTIACPCNPHDWPLDWIVTRDRVIETHTQFPRPTGLDWAALSNYRERARV